ncbi:MAG: peptidase [Acidobacteria bacterium]|nr:MAG: peptidase [Acidobacteriota bacterium]
MLANRTRAATHLFLVLLVTAAGLQAQGRITTPKQQFGFNIGDDYVLVNYTQYVDYLKKLDHESDRINVEEIGKSSEGRPIYLAIITSPENHKKLARYKEISQRLSHAEGVTDDQARALAAEGKAVVWIDGGIHATEVLGAQQLIESIYQLVSRTDPETTRLLNDVIIRHDDNRDFYMTALPETEAINRVLFREWFPQIVYNHHQTGPAGAVMFAPPFRDPFNFFFDTLVMTLLDEVGAAMHSRFAAEGKPGVTSRTGANYSTWWNGGLRTSPYFHNQIGLLTETIGNPTPINIPFVPEKSLPKNDLPFPISPQGKWHFRQSIDYSITANRAVVDYASRNKDRLLFSIYRMGMNSIERGSRDTWTNTPRRIENVQMQVVKDRAVTGRGGTVPLKYYEALRDPALRDPRGYIIPADQPDFLTATKFVNALIKNGITIHRATSPFSVSGKSYPAGSYVVKTAQAFRPHVLDMFEPQDHPDDFEYPGAPPTPPYDSAGWTLAYQMGVKFDRILEAFNGPFEKLAAEVKSPAGTITQVPAPAGYLLSHAVNDSFIAVNRLLKSNEEVYWVKTAFRANGKTYPAGTHFISAKPGTLAKLQKMTQEIGLTFEATGTKPAGEALKLGPVRIGLWDRAGGSVPSGWTRLVLENFEFPFNVVYQTTFDSVDLAEKFDVLIFVDDGAPNAVAQLKKFLQDGGTILAIGGSTTLAYSLDLPVIDALAEIQPDGRALKLPRTQFYVPGSLLQAKIDNTNPLAFGMPDRADFFFDNSPAFRLRSDAERTGVRMVAWYESNTPLRSGWAWGQKHLENTGIYYGRAETVSQINEKDQ